MSLTSFLIKQLIFIFTDRLFEAFYSHPVKEGDYRGEFKRKALVSFHSTFSCNGLKGTVSSIFSNNLKIKRTLFTQWQLNIILMVLIMSIFSATRARFIRAEHGIIGYLKMSFSRFDHGAPIK